MRNRIVISNIEIEVNKKNIKNMYLSVMPPEGKVRISAPVNAGDETIQLFARAKMGWIKKQIDKCTKKQKQEDRKFISGEAHYIWGRRYRLDIRYNKKNQVEIYEDKLILFIKEASTAQQRERFLIEWYRNQLKEKLPSLVKRWEDIIGVQVESVRVKNMRTRWGTCNIKDKRIWINLQLAKKPIECLEYVVVHELVHLLEKNHNDIFNEYMDKYLPNWRMMKVKLNQMQE